MATIQNELEVKVSIIFFHSKEHIQSQTMKYIYENIQNKRAP